MRKCKDCVSRMICMMRAEQDQIGGYDEDYEGEYYCSDFEPLKTDEEMREYFENKIEIFSSYLRYRGNRI